MENTKPYVKFQKGTPMEYKLLSDKDNNTLYFITDDGIQGTLYLGEMMIVGDITSTDFEQLEDNMELADSNLAMQIGEALAQIAELSEELDALDVEDAATANEYVAAVSQADGKITVEKKSLPTYTLSTGNEDGTVQFNDNTVEVKGYSDLVNYIAKLENLTLSTSSSINMKSGTGNLHDILYNKSPDVQASEKGLIIPDGSWINFPIVDVKEAGIYEVQLKQDIDSNASLHLETNENYFVNGEDKYIYLKQGGNNTIVITNTGDTVCFLNDIIFENTDNYLPTFVINNLKTYSESIVPDAWEEKIDPPEWNRDYRDLSEYNSGVVFDSANKMNNYTATNITSTSNIASSYVTMIAGNKEWIEYEIEAPYTGVYALSSYITWLGGATNFTVKDEYGYGGVINYSQTGYSYNFDQDILLYLKEGKNTIRFTITGSKNCSLASFTIYGLNAQGLKVNNAFVPLLQTV